MEQLVRGLFVARTERQYDGFTDSTGRDAPGGVARRFYVATGIDRAPTMIKVKQADHDTWQAVDSLSFGDELLITCDAFAERNRIVLTARKVEVTSAGLAPVKAARG